MALERLLSLPEVAAICTDSQSLLETIQSGSSSLTIAPIKLTTYGLQGITGSEEKDVCGKKVAAIMDSGPRSEAPSPLPTY